MRALLSIVLVMLVGCGQSGDLYLPPKQPAPESAPPAAPPETPKEEDKDEK